MQSQIILNNRKNLILSSLVIHIPSAFSSESPENYTMDLANRIYVDNALPLYECVARVLPDEVKDVDFSQVSLFNYFSLSFFAVPLFVNFAIIYGIYSRMCLFTTLSLSVTTVFGYLFLLLSI